MGKFLVIVIAALCVAGACAAVSLSSDMQYRFDDFQRSARSPPLDPALELQRMLYGSEDPDKYSRPEPIPDRVMEYWLSGAPMPPRWQPMRGRRAV